MGRLGRSSDLMSSKLLAQINVARLLHPEGDERVSGFFDNLDRINALAEGSDGFVWRLKDEESGNATSIAVSPDPMLIVNMSVWRDIEALKAFAYRSGHAQIMAQRRDWFEKSSEPMLALWWVDENAMPRPEHGLARLNFLRKKGPSEKAFTFATAAQFPAPDPAVADPA